MKNIDIAILAKKNELVKLFMARDTLVKLSVKFGSEPEDTIMKLTGLDVLSEENQNKFIMYNKGLVGINTKDTSISLAYNELHKIIKSLGNDIITVIDEITKLEPVSVVTDNAKVLSDYLDGVGVDNLFNALDSDKALNEYATYKIHNIVSTLSNPGADNNECMNLLYSISDTIISNVKSVDTVIISKYKKAIQSTAASIEIDNKHIKDNIDSDVPVVESSVLSKDDFTVELSIISDNLVDYLTLSSHAIDNSTLVGATRMLYTTLQESEKIVNELIDGLTIGDYSNLITIIKSTDKSIKQYKDSEYTDKEFTKVYSEYKALTINMLNNVCDVINSAVDNSNKLNRLTYVLYLTKAIMEKVLIEATIK